MLKNHLPVDMQGTLRWNTRSPYLISAVRCTTNFANIYFKNIKLRLDHDIAAVITTGMSPHESCAWLFLSQVVITMHF
jgi:hypothetical protein